MFGINEILEKAYNKKPLTKEERIKILRSKRIDPKVIEYLMERLDKLYIEVLGDYEGSLFQLMPIRKLEGWCWQTTESAIVFLNDDDYVERGNLYPYESSKEYYHSWICFTYNGIEYVLDPCLNFICKKKDYSKLFGADVKGRATAKAIKEELIRQITAPKEEDNSERSKNFDKIMKEIIGIEYDKLKEKTKDEVIVHGPEDINTPLYRNGAGYKAEIENGKIKKLKVHFYYTDC